jgi:hypothetical protein
MMTLPHRRRALSAVAPALLLCTLPAQAAEEDTQFWLYLNTVLPLGGDATGTFEISPRARDEGDLLLLRGTVEVPAAEWARVGAGAAYVESNGVSEVRISQQATLDAGPLAFRTRVEQRLFEGEPRMQLRLRQRVATSIPLAEDTTLTGSAELLYIAHTENPEDEARVDSWRAVAGVQQQLSPRLTVSLNYLAILSPREDAPDRLSHVPQLQLVFRP